MADRCPACQVKDEGSALVLEKALDRSNGYQWAFLLKRNPNLFKELRETFALVEGQA